MKVLTLKYTSIGLCAKVNQSQCGLNLSWGIIRDDMHVLHFYSGL